MRKLLSLVPVLVMAACDLSPDLVMPDAKAPEAFKENTTDAPALAEMAPAVEPASDGKWKRADEKAHIEEFAWWRMFHDDALNALEEQAMKENPSLDVAAERVTRARAAAEVADASLYPEVSVGAGPSIQRNSPGAIKPASFAYKKPYTLYNARGTISYELDLFGKNRNAAKAAALQAEGEENNFYAARLSLQADVAQTYFQLAALRAEADTLKRAVATRKKALELTRKKRDVGAVDDVVLSSAENDLSGVEGDQASVLQQQSVQEHALAILVGQPPANFSAPITKLNKLPPVVPAGLPSALLERRPDIQAAVKNIAGANASIGVARAGYFPDISLSAVGGFTSGDLGQLFNWSNRTWTIGPLAGTVLTQPIFQGGAISARVAESRSDFTSAVANYRASVLQAFREVEDNLSGLRNVNDQGAASAQALKSAQRTFDIVDARFKVGSASYLEQLDAERNLLAAQRNNAQVMGNRYITTVQLVKALGGSWEQPPAKPAVKVEAVKPAPETPIAVKSDSEASWADSVTDAFSDVFGQKEESGKPAASKVNSGLPPAELLESK